MDYDYQSGGYSYEDEPYEYLADNPYPRPTTEPTTVVMISNRDKERLTLFFEQTVYHFGFDPTELKYVQAFDDLVDYYDAPFSIVPSRYNPRALPVGPEGLRLLAAQVTEEPPRAIPVPRHLEPHVLLPPPLAIPSPSEVAQRSSPPQKWSPSIPVQPQKENNQ